MIRVQRPTTEPAGLTSSRTKRLPALRAVIAATGTFDPKTIKGYEVARKPLFDAQYKKCCYCERQPFEKHQTVEHLRPKSVYWWLSWTWTNLLFCCLHCNEHKGDAFPLRRGAALTAEAAPPGTERPLLLDPADPASGADPLEHIVFRLTPRGWVPYPRNGSVHGRETIRRCGLDTTEMLDAYKTHALLIADGVERIRSAVATRDPATVHSVWGDVTGRLLSVSMPLTGLSHDILDHHFPRTTRRLYGVTLDLRPPL